MLEVRLLILFSIAWIAVFLIYAGFLPVAGLLELDLYRFYSIAAVIGWLAGNVYQLRRVAEANRRSLWPSDLLIYLVGPPSLVLIVRGLAPPEHLAAAPFVPLYSLGVYGLFFLVPVTLAATRTPRRRPGE